MRTSLVVIACLAGGAAAGKLKPPHGATRITIDYDYASFHHAEHHYVVEWKGSGYQAGKAAVDAKAVEGLYAALTNLRASDHELQCISHTDDYPSYRITVEGDEPISVGSTSNCHANVPWNIVVKGKPQVQFTGDAGRAVQGLLNAVDPATWKTPDRPEASTAWGGEYVLLDELTPARPAGSPATACAAGLEADPRASQAFGQPIHITEAQLGCDLGTSSDCTTTTMTAGFTWQGVDTRIELGCASGKIAWSAAAVATIAELRTFLASKPVRAAVKLSQSPPRLWDAQGWRIEGDGDLPMLDLVAGKARVEARSVGDKGPSAGAYWKALGLDARKLTKKVDRDYFETTATLDFAGHLAK